MADVLIAGGGLAGSALAIHLGRRGLSVELLERGRFPKEKPCGEGLMPAGVAALGRLGVAAEGAAFRGVRYHFCGRIAEGSFPKTAGLPATGRGWRRRDLDAALFARAARTPGVSAHAEARVEGPILENGRVAGLFVEGETHRARLVVAADGAHSRLRHALGLDVPARRKRIGARAHFRLAQGRLPGDWVDIYLGRGYELYVTPLPKGELLVAALAEVSALDGLIENQFERWCAEQEELTARLEGAERISELQAIAPLSGGARRGFAPGLVLLGDAAGFTDPITGGGMTQALLAAELLADRIGRRLGQGEEWLAEFDRARNALLRDYRRVTAMVLWLAEHPALIGAALGLLRRTPALFSHLLGVSGGARRLYGGEVQWERESSADAGRRHLDRMEHKGD